MLSEAKRRRLWVVSVALIVAVDVAILTVLVLKESRKKPPQSVMTLIEKREPWGCTWNEPLVPEVPRVAACASTVEDCQKATFKEIVDQYAKGEGPERERWVACALVGNPWCGIWLAEPKGNDGSLRPRYAVRCCPEENDCIKAVELPTSPQGYSVRVMVGCMPFDKLQAHLADHLVYE